jgi:hypothetical protein
VFEIKGIEKITTHVLWSVIFFRNHAIYEIMWKNMVRTRQASDDNTVPVLFMLDN